MVDRVAEGTSRGVQVIRAAAQRARTAGHPILASWSEPLPWVHALEIFARARATHDDLFYWEHPNRCLATVGIGAGYVVGGDGRERFARARAAWQALLRTAVVSQEVPHAELNGPTLLGGFSFDPARPATSLWNGFPACRLVLPQLMVTTTDEAAWMTVNRVVHPDSDPETELDEAARLLHGLTDVCGVDRVDPSGENLDIRGLVVTENMPAEAWQSLVAGATRSIRAGRMDKLVLARSVRVSGGRFNPSVIVRRLRSAHPGCIIFAISHGNRCFLGATPEQLVRLQAGTVEVSALAGTRRRGADEQADARLGSELLASPKERSEHAMVVQAIAEQLAGVCDEVDIPEHPALMKLRQVQHLHTPIKAGLATAGGVLNLVERLHPTPAVGGVPQGTAMSFLRQHEQLDRGWYAAPVGWVDQDGEGEFAVAIRSALLYDGGTDGSFGQAALFAGCGIMADSDPASEYAESCSKLSAMLSVLDASA